MFKLVLLTILTIQNIQLRIELHTSRFLKKDKKPIKEKRKNLSGFKKYKFKETTFVINSLVKLFTYLSKTKKIESEEKVK